MASIPSNMKLVISIIKFLKDESARDTLTPDTRESLEVAVQCLQTAYDIDSSDARLTESQKDVLSLDEIFNSYVLSFEEMDDQLPGELKEAIIMKNIGNNLMKNNQFSEAIRYYTAAIEIDNQNAIYYGNRAAAYSKLNEFKSAIKDCEMAIKIDPKYAKAYGRMGLAFTSLELYDKAVEAFNKALELDPDNQSYQNNLKLAFDKKDQSPPGAAQGMSGLNIDWGNIFSNPAFRNMASTLMQDQSIINALSAGMNSLNQQPPPTDGSGDGGASGSTANPTDRRFDMLLEASHYLAAQLHAANPDLVEQFRQNATRNPNPSNPDNRGMLK
ncbi:small glutamine-rich tetratricopeptide repeat-containing protein beta isoform X2 [Parasteatoda tepidariorum]|uniref:small glutamine-rich tetratricopeptide repeat-containing protein beta isoform X2 n=1 Tax=Parasteatoda tepidariorum TaxID=114398 RepID=UPI0039BD1F8F